MQKLVLLFSLIFITSCVSKNARNPSSVDAKPKHYVITLHGLRGNDQSYGEIHQIVKNNIEKINPSYDVQVFNWTYPVGAKVEAQGMVWNPHLIGRKFNQDFFVGPNHLIPELGAQDKISLIAYSMGGQMAMTWYYDTMFNYQWHPELKYSQSDYEKLQTYLGKVENVIGLGSVFWGSLDSEFGWAVLENGSLEEVRKNYPKFKALCETPEMKAMVGETSMVKNVVNNILGRDKELSVEQKNENFVKGSVVAACEAVSLLGSNPITANMKTISPSILSGLTKQIVSKGNVSPHELNHMRLTSDVTTEMRIGRIQHLINPSLRDRFKTKWSSIVGVFPCMGKKDKGLTCREFQNDSYKKVNDGLLAIFSGVIRRETDGPVMSPSAVADFIFYTELPGHEDSSVPFDSFYNTNEISKQAGVQNQEIFVENMHATVVPALESLTGMLKSIGDTSAEAMKKFDDSLGTDVVIVNKECGNPETCGHPNYKHMLQILSNCEVGAAGCDHSYLNKYFKVSEEKKRLDENNLLRQELGSLAITMNIRLPKNVVIDDVLKNDIMKAIKFQTYNYGSGPWGENRVDAPYSPYAIQIARPSEVISSYAVVQRYADMNILRLFMVGRAWTKPGKQEQGAEAFKAGVPVRFEVSLPGVKSRRVSAKVKPTYSTYIDMFMK